MVEAIAHQLQIARPHLHARLRELLGDEPPRAPVGAALRAALARLLAESGLVLVDRPDVEAPLVAMGGPDGRRLLLLFRADADGVEEEEPGGARAGLVAALTALAAVRAARGALPLGVTLVCDPDRALGSLSLAGLALPPADWCLWDGGGYHEGHPWLALGCHGLARIRLRAAGPGGPAGLGALIVNPLWRLVWALAALKSPNEEIHLPDFYTAVREPGEGEFDALAAAAPYLTAAVTRSGGQPLLGLHGPSLALVQAFSPAVSLVGLGVEGGAPGRVPRAAWAELALSLVPRQTPSETTAAVAEHLQAQDLADIEVELLAGYAGLDTLPDHPLVEVAGRLFGSNGARPALLPYAEEPAPLCLLSPERTIAALGLGAGRAAWATLEERVAAQAVAIAGLLLHLAGGD